MSSLYCRCVDLERSDSTHTCSSVTFYRKKHVATCTRNQPQNILYLSKVLLWKVQRIMYQTQHQEKQSVNKDKIKGFFVLL